jgi:tRNA(adenine34) deaminase
MPWLWFSEFMVPHSPNFMQLALEQARAAALRGEVPVGAVVVREGEVIAAAGNETEALKDPTAHAEVLAIRRACEVVGSARLVECDLYVTLEPCPMCAQAISFTRVRRLYFGAYDPKGGGVEHGARVLYAPSCHHLPEIYGGIEEKEALALLQGFFRAKRAR